MHYYKFNIADYRKDTAHLSRLEHSIYRDLIDWYYLDEKPISSDIKIVSRRLRLEASEVESLLNVLHDFFELREEGYYHGRIDDEIHAYHLLASTNRENGKKGGRPRNTETENNPVGSDWDASRNPTVTLTNNHKPLGYISPTEIVDAEASTTALDRVPYQKIIDLYHEVLPELRPVIKINSTRQANIRQRWKNDLPDLDEWRKYFEHVRRSPFLMGKSPPSQGRKVFIADIDFLINGTNAVKIAEGKYHG
jgi:uncharacterized protein YdaU (DUF1376 family)